MLITFIRRRLVVTCSLVLLGVAAGTAFAQQEVSVDPSVFRDLEFRNIGPAITGGRIVEFAVVEATPAIIYAATASGGAFKTTNGGTTWEPVFEKEHTVSIGAIAVSQQNPNLVWIGTGEANSIRSSSWGDGVYKSVNGGRTWTQMGLPKSQHVGRIVIHPSKPDTVYVAALGALWGSNEERGLYKTSDGGESWVKVLGISEYTGVVDVAMDPRDPETLYAAAFQRERRYYSFLGGGPEGGVFKSTDGAVTWAKLETGLPGGAVGRIGLAVCRSQPDRIYAAVVGPEGGIFRSDDRGASWEKRSDEISTHWFYGQIVCDPRDPERLFVPMTRHYVSVDGGRSFRDDFARAGVHADHHTIWINPNDTSHMVLGTDGGIYISRDSGAHWDFQDHLSITQFYTVGVDMQEPFYFVYGGTQDNSSFGGPSGTRSSDGIVNADWSMTVGGDGFYVQVDPTDHTTVYTESQYGNVFRFDTRTGERRSIQPQPRRGEKFRWNWSAPILLSPHDPSTIYIGANYLFKSANRGDAWTRISPDLSRQIDEWTLPLQGVVQPADAIDLHASTADYGNITSIAESPLRAGLLAVGTDDGLVQITRDGGKTWVKRDAFPGVPEQTRVSRVILSSAAEGTVYAAFDGHQDNNFKPYVLKSTDYGQSWTSIASNLPDHGPVHVIVEHFRTPKLLFAGTEFGVFFTLDGGGRWLQLKNNLPTVAVHDIVVHPRENDLVLATHGRGFWILDDITALERMAADAAAASRLFPVRRAWQFQRAVRGRNATGQQRFIGPNPPEGAILTYFARAGDRVSLDVLDHDGTPIRRVVTNTAAPHTGVHRAVWDLRSAPPAQAGGGPSRDRGAFVLPGTYEARLRVGSEEHRESVQVVGDPLITLSDADRRTRQSTLTTLAELQAAAAAATSVIDRLGADLRMVRAAMAAVPSLSEALLEEHQALSGKLAEITTVFRGEPARGIALTPGPPALAQQVAQLHSQVEASTALPTEEQRRLTAESQDIMKQQIERLNELSRALAALNEKLDAADVPWTAGRPLALPRLRAAPGGA